KEVSPRPWETFWTPPLVVRDEASGALAVIFLDTRFLAPWAVFVQHGQTYEQACTISFRPDVTNGAQLLPSEVQTLAQRIGATLGDGRNEGTLQSTGRRLYQLQHIWANAALRPWALTDREVYNSRAEVDAGLRAWSRGAPSFRAAYAALQADYPRAEA